MGINNNNSVLSKFANFAGKAIFGDNAFKKDLPSGLAGMHKAQSSDQLKFSAPGISARSSQSITESPAFWAKQGSLVS